MRTAAVSVLQVASHCRKPHFEFLPIRSGLHYLPILRGDRRHACDDDQAADDRPGDQQKAVGDRQREGLLSDLQTQNLPCSSGRCRQTRGLAVHAGGQAEQSLIGGRLAKLNAQSQNVGVKLFADREEMLHEGGSDLSAEEPHSLEITGKRKNVDRTGEGAGVDHFEDDGAHHAVEGKGQTDRHDRLRKPEIGSRPCGREMRIHETGNRYQSKADGQDQPGIDVFQQVHGEQTADALGQADPKQDGPVCSGR